MKKVFFRDAQPQHQAYNTLNFIKQIAQHW